MSIAITKEALAQQLDLLIERSKHETDSDQLVRLTTAMCRVIDRLNPALIPTRNGSQAYDLPDSGHWDTTKESLTNKETSWKYI